MAKKEIVVYGNNLNKIQLPRFTAYQQNLLMKILIEIKDKGNDFIFIPCEKLQVAFNSEFKNNVEIGEYMLSLRNNFFKADFKRILPRDEQGRVGIEFINLFQSFVLFYDEPDDTPQEQWKNFKAIKIKVNPQFAYIINELTKEFTAFEYAEFIELSGSYTKTLYRLLKQYRSTGKMIMAWSEFRRVMDFPQALKSCDIDKILKVSLKELLQERNLFEKARIPFRGLKYTKDKQGTKYIQKIIFTFKAETQEPKKESKIPQLESSPQKDMELGEYRFKTARIKGKENEFIIQEAILLPSGEVNILTAEFSRNFANLDDFKNNVEIVS